MKRPHTPAHILAVFDVVVGQFEDEHPTTNNRPVARVA